MELINIPHRENKSQLTFVKAANVEFVNPIEKFMNDLIDSYKTFRLSTYHFAYKHNNRSPIGRMSIDDILTGLEKMGLERWEKKYKEIMETELPDSMFQILNCNDKDIQSKILKPPLELTTLSLQKFIIKAWQLQGFRYSQYRFEHMQKGLNPQELPEGFLLNDSGDVEVYGSTLMKQGELKNAIMHRKVTIAKFLDNDSEWHCFYYNYNSIDGKEANELSHIHYISNNWTIKRNIVLEELRKRHHSFTSSVHINYKKAGR